MDCMMIIIFLCRQYSRVHFAGTWGSLPINERFTCPRVNFFSRFHPVIHHPDRTLRNGCTRCTKTQQNVYNQWDKDPVPRLPFVDVPGGAAVYGPFHGIRAVRMRVGRSFLWLVAGLVGFAGVSGGSFRVFSGTSISQPRPASPRGGGCKM